MRATIVCIEYCGARDVFHFYRGRVALYALLRAIGVGPGDEVVLQAFTCVAVPAPIVGLGARPVYVDIDRNSYSFNPEQLERCVGKKTRAIVVQHTFGIPAPMDVVTNLARKYGTTIVEDCAHACGSTYQGRQLGRWGDAAFYSYSWGKPLVLGIGGSLTVNSDTLLAKTQALYDQFVAPPAFDVAQIRAQYVLRRVLQRPSLFWLARGLYRRLHAKGVMIAPYSRAELAGRLDDEYRQKMPAFLQKRLVRRLHADSANIAQRREVTGRYAAGLRRLEVECPEPSSDTVLLRYPILAKDKLESSRRRRQAGSKWQIGTRPRSIR